MKRIFSATSIVLAVLAFVLACLGIWASYEFKLKKRDQIRNEFVSSIEQTTTLVKEHAALFEQVASGEKPIQALEEHTQKTLSAFEEQKYKADRMADTGGLDQKLVDRFKNQITTLQVILKVQSLIADSSGSEILRRHSQQAVIDYLVQTEAFLETYNSQPVAASK